MRVLYFSRDYTPHDHRFLQALSQSEHQIFSLRLERGARQVEDRPIPAQVEQVLWRGGKSEARRNDWPSLWLDLRRVLGKIKPDVVHAGSIQTAAFLTALAGFQPLVSMSWGSDLLRDADRDAWHRWATRYTLQRTAVLVGDCQAVSDKAQTYGFPPERIVLFPWGVDLRQFSPGPGDDWRARRGWKDAFVLLCLRSWEPLYGVDMIARAFVRAAQEAPDLRLILLGGGSQAGLIRRILSEGGVEERVFFGGQVSNRDLPQYYRAADLYLSASHSDGSSVSLMEALACGLPALVSDIPGNREWITPGEQGWLFTDGDEPALAQAIVRAVRDESGEMRAKARRLAEERADWPRNFENLLRAYEMAARLKGGRRYAS